MVVGLSTVGRILIFFHSLVMSLLMKYNFPLNQHTHHHFQGKKVLLLFDWKVKKLVFLLNV